MKLFKMKFTITIQDLLNQYSNRQETDNTHLCMFIQYNLLPRRSIFHKIILHFKYHNTKSTDFINQLAKTLNVPPQITLNATLQQHPNFQFTNPNLYEYRLQTLQQLASLFPNLTFKY